MEIPVLVEPIGDNGFRARGVEPFAFTAEGATREDALANLQKQIHAHLQNGAALMSLQMAPTVHPLAEFAGMWKGDPLIAEWKESMAEYRRKVDPEPL